MSADPKEIRPSEVIYQIYPATFKDSNGDGHGDLKGITEKLDYIKSLNVDAIWISPFFKSPDGKKGDGGYAVSHYGEIGDKFGTMADYEELIKEAHKRGLRVYNDFVLCHTADDHDWFEKSGNREPGYENRYVWHDGKKDHQGHRIPPNNWKSAFGGSAWKFDEKRQQFYLHHFDDSQPSLNLNDDSVQEAILKEMEFWLKKKVDGFRLDALPFANYDPKFRDNPVRMHCPDAGYWQWQWFEHSMCQPQTIELVAKIKKLLDRYPGTKALGEVVAGRDGGSRSIDVARDYINPKTGLDSCYTESLIQFTEYPSADRLRNVIKESIQNFPDGGLCNNVSNHDFPRAVTRMTQGLPVDVHSKVVRQIMALGAALPGSFCMYQGEELRLPQARIPEDIPEDWAKRADPDPKMRAGARTPMPWNAAARNAGFSDADNPYLPVPASHVARAVSEQEDEPGSMLNFTRRLLLTRKTNPAMNKGTARVVDIVDHVVSFIRETPEQTAFFAFNMSPHTITLDLKKLDAETRKKLNSKEDSLIIPAYGYACRGLKGPQIEEWQAIQRDGRQRKLKKSSAQTTIVAADMLIADHFPPSEAAKSILKEKDLAEHEKHTIDAEISRRFLETEQEPQYTLGGATSLTLWTLKELLGDKADIHLLGPVANDAPGAVIKKKLKSAKVHLPNEDWPEGIRQETAVSHIVGADSGKPTILTCSGMEPEAFHGIRKEKPKILPDSIAKSDIVYVPGSQAEKFGLTFVGEQLALRWDLEKQLVLALPTHATFGPSDIQVFKNLIASANVVLGSDEEFCRLYDIHATRPIDDKFFKTEVAEKIQEAFKQNVLANHMMPCPLPQVAFIMRGKQPVLLVTAEEIEDIPVPDVKDVKNTLGVDEAAYAGFLAGYVRNLDHKKSAAIATALAAEKMKQESPSPHLENPRQSLNAAFHEKKMRTIAHEFESRARAVG